ncbi:uncharacterized protein LOC116192240 [Punica granatum]|uniref:Uncharacterized protein LOC116192240 n=3 Tax=Punica granatum TaxID=22663 RepID=A0A6P8C4C6_PUNGR|nr:uncharacterized protein LOC116192240 [Punica granatum]
MKMMGSTNSAITRGFLLLVIAATTLVVGQAETVVVGGSENWRPGYNYTDWALKSSPFYINDKLVFKYEAPQNVYLLPNLWSYIKCDFKNAKLLASETNGAGNGFEVVLNQWRLYYFASSSGNDCSSGMMKFFAMPLPHWNY